MAICFYTRRKAKDRLTIKTDQEEVKEVCDLKFLGVILDSQLKFDEDTRQNINCFTIIWHYIPIKGEHHQNLDFQYVISWPRKV